MRLGGEVEEDHLSASVTSFSEPLPSQFSPCQNSCSMRIRSAMAAHPKPLPRVCCSPWRRGFRKMRLARSSSCPELEILRNRGRESTHWSVAATWPKPYAGPRRLSKPLRSCGWSSRCHVLLLCLVAQWISCCDNCLDAVASKSHAARGHFHTSAFLRFGEHLWQARWLAESSGRKGTNVFRIPHVARLLLKPVMNQSQHLAMSRYSKSSQSEDSSLPNPPAGVENLVSTLSSCRAGYVSSCM